MLQVGSAASPAVRLVAWFSFALCLVLAPIQSLIWNGVNAPGWIAVAPAQAVIEAGSDLASGMLPYDLFGRFFVLVYLGALVVLAALVRRQGIGGKSQKVLSVSLATLSIAAVAGFVAYWVAGWASPELRDLAFWKIEVPMLAVTVLLLCLYGTFAIRGGWLPRGAAWLAALTPVLALGATAALQYMPHGPMLAVCLTLLGLARARSAV